MLHIILLILKIIGWILLAILGLVVLLLCVVFFVPLCYRADGSCRGTLDSLYGKIRFSWLCHLVSGSAQYQDGKLSWTVRIAWKKIRSEEAAEEIHLDEPLSDDDEAFPYESQKKAELTEETDSEEGKPGEKAADLTNHTEEAERRETAGSKDSEDSEDSEEFESDIRRLEELMQEGQPDSKVPDMTSETEAEETPKPEGLDSGRLGKGTSGKKKEKGPGFFSRIGKLYQRLTEKIQSLIEKLKYTFQKICDTIKSASDKKDKILLFITDEVHKSALGAVFVELKRLLRFLKPGKMQADVHFGFEDPYYTGKVLAALSMIYPFLGDHADIEPDFEQKILEGNIMISGKLRVLYVIIMLWNLVWNKNVRTTIKHIRKFEL